MMNKIARLVFWGAAALVCVVCSSQNYEILWEYEIDGYGASAVAIGPDGTVYLTKDASGYLVALNPDGTLKWIYSLETSQIPYPPSIDSDGTVYISSNEGRIYAVSPSGTLKWQQTIGEGDYEVSAQAIASDGTIYIGASDGNLYVFDSDGNLKWTYENVGSPTIGPTGTIYCIRGLYSASSDSLIALNPDGTCEWEYDPGGEIKHSPAIGAEGTLYFGVHAFGLGPGLDTSYLYALGADSVMQWKYTLVDGEFITPPVIDVDGSIYCGVREAEEIGIYLYAISPEGSFEWKVQSEDYVYSPTIGSDGTIYFGSDSRYLYAVGQNGTLKYEYKMGKNTTSTRSPAIASDGSIYFGVCEGFSHCYLYAIPTESYGLADSPWPKFGHDNQITNRAEGL